MGVERVTLFGGQNMPLTHVKGVSTLDSVPSGKELNEIYCHSLPPPVNSLHLSDGVKLHSRTDILTVRLSWCTKRPFNLLAISEWKQPMGTR